MSYAIDIMFHKVDNKLEAFELAQEAMKVVAANANDILEDNKYYCPMSRKEAKEEGTPSHMYSKYEESVSQATRYWIRALMTYRFMYWPEQKLLGVIGHESLLEPLGWKGVYFQNSTDQDYEYKEWADICAAFDEAVQKCQNMTDEAIKEKADETTLDDYDTEERFQWYCDYTRRSAVYQAIYEMLDINSILYGYGKSEKYEYFAMNAIPDNDTYFQLELHARALAAQYID